MVPSQLNSRLGFINPGLTVSTLEHVDLLIVNMKNRLKFATLRMGLENNSLTHWFPKKIRHRIKDSTVHLSQQNSSALRL